jgi:hypothetical protein
MCRAEDLIQAAQTESESTRDEPYSGLLHGQRPQRARSAVQSVRQEATLLLSFESRGTRTMSGAAEVRRTLKFVQRAFEANVDRLPARAQYWTRNAASIVEPLASRAWNSREVSPLVSIVVPVYNVESWRSTTGRPTGRLTSCRPTPPATAAYRSPGRRMPG